MDFFAYRKLADRIESALEQPERMQDLRHAARATAVQRFDLKRVLLPRWMALFDDLVHGRRPGLAGADPAGAAIKRPRTISPGALFR